MAPFTTPVTRNSSRLSDDVHRVIARPFGGFPEG